MEHLFMVDDIPIVISKKGYVRQHRDIRLGTVTFNVIYKGDKVKRFLRPVVINLSDLNGKLSAPDYRNEWERQMRLELGSNPVYRDLFPKHTEITDVVPVRINPTLFIKEIGWTNNCQFLDRSLLFA